jgi:hypothetical protein
MSIPDPVLAACLTVMGGAITLVAGQVFVKAVLEPAVDLKKEIGRIAYSLDYYANRRYHCSEEEKAETRNTIRQHACRLREYANLVLAYELWQTTLGLPSKKNILLASEELIGHSNFPHKPEGIRYDRSREIRGYLGIKTLSDIRKDENQI